MKKTPKPDKEKLSQKKEGANRHESSGGLAPDIMLSAPMHEDAPILGATKKEK